MLTSTKMSNEFSDKMIPVDSESTGINNFATSFENYFYESTIAGIPVNELSLEPCTNALKSAMTSVALNDAGLAMQSGIIAFWTMVSSVFLTIWTTSPPLIAVIPPINLSTINATLQSVFASNKKNSLNKNDSWNAISNVLHPLQLGGIAKIGPTPGVDTPIL